jgi:glucosylceramidase
MRKLGLVLACVGFLTQATAQQLPVIEAEAWVTLPDRSKLFELQEQKIEFSTVARGGGSTIVIDESLGMQEVDGFGFSLTGGSAELMMLMTPEARTALLRDLFATDGDKIGVSYVRLTIGASDLNSFVYSYDDLPEGETDLELRKFDLGQDKKDVIPVMQEILSINPDIKIMASPWSPPVWMKTNDRPKGGTFNEEYYDVYARYFVKYIQQMAVNGIAIDAVTIQNEPLNSNNTPSMRMSAQQQATFIKDYLGPQFKNNGLETKIVLFDHNLDRPDYPLTVLSDPEASSYVDGSGFHHYGGDMSAMSVMHAAFPDKNVYFTEQMIIERAGTDRIEIAAQVKRMIIDVTENWSRNVLLWNFAADPLNDPHTDDGGCPMCQGAVTLDGDTVTKNLAYYVIAHASKFIRPGSVRIGSTGPGDMTVAHTTDEERREVLRLATYDNYNVLPNVAFRTPDGKIVLVVANNTWDVSSFRIQFRSRWAGVSLAPGAVGTYVWQP